MFADFEKVRFGQSTEEAAEDPRRYSSCDLLIIDDLGTEVTNQFTNSCLYTVLNNRINLGRPTVISTNLSGKDLQSRYAERITSRLSGEFTPLRFVGADIRRQKLLNRH
jgi:DNA replication protein DnaC